LSSIHAEFTDPWWRVMSLCRRLPALLVSGGLLCACQPDKGDEANGIDPDVTDHRPNIVLIVADDLGYADLGYNGSEIPTPTLDALAAEGLVLTNFYASMSCSPTRAMLMSGTDAHQAGLGVMAGPTTRPEHRGEPGYVGYLNFRVASMADLLADAGYNTYITGKWHLGMDVSNGPVARGFRRAFVSLDGAAHLGGWDWRGPQPANYRNGDELVQVGDDFYSTRDYTERMIGYIDGDRGDDKPFFAYLAYTAPHWPLQAPDESIARFRGRYDEGYEKLYRQRFENLEARGLAPVDAVPDETVFSPRWDELEDDEKALAARRMEVYAAMVSDLDTYVGRFIDYIESIDELDNTFILFMSDNGADAASRDLLPQIAQHIGVAYDHSLENLGRPNTYVMYGPNWATASAAPFRRHKFTGFEGGIHVPAFVRYPGSSAAGTRNDAFLTVMDVLPTFLELAGTEHPGDLYRGEPVVPIQGKSFLPLLDGDVTAVHDEALIVGWELWGHRSVRQGDWKIVWDASAGDDARWLLFNLAEDPGERNDLSTMMPGKLTEMIGVWDRYAEENRVIYIGER
jgi:arylsulfatase A-like enzyme